MQKLSITRIIFRIVLDILILFLVIEGFWPAALVLSLIGGWVYPFFIEIIVAGFAFDSLYGVPEAGVWSHIFLIGSVALFLIVLLFKKILRK